MERKSLPAKSGGAIDIDVCFACQAIWFDKGESWQLAPDGVVQLFQLVHSAGKATTPQFAARLGCPHCKTTLNKAFDLVKTSRFSFFSCTHEHGRFTAFHQFLVEKQFVRELSPAERLTLSAQVSQIRCNGCGAGVNLKTETACGYCRAPISVFDRDAAKKAIDHYLLERGKQLPTQPNTSPAIASTDRSSGAHDFAGGLAIDVVWAMAHFAARGVSKPFSTSTASGSVFDVFRSADEIPTAGVLPSADELLSGQGSGFFDATDLAQPLGQESSQLIADAFESVPDTDVVDLISDGIGSFLDGLSIF